MPPEEDVVAFSDSSDHSLRQRTQQFFHNYSVAVPAIVLAGAIICFALIVGGRFFDPFNLSLIIQQVSIIGTLALGQTLIILTMGIDLSVGAIMILSSVFMGRMAVDYGLPPVIALLIGLAVGAGCGAVNGTLVTRFRLPPFIATLGAWNVFAALTLWFSGAQTIQAQALSSAGALLLWTGNTVGVFGARFSYGSLMMLALVVLLWYVLRWTAWGRHVYATGDDRQAADLAGIRTGRVLLSVYIVAGLICAITAWILIGRIGSVSPQAGFMANLNSITAVVIGGTSLFGGRGSIYGTLMGAVIVGVFRNGLSLAGVEVLWQQFAVGLLVIVAVAIDQWIRKVSV
ncbi:ABC transporter permease [Salinisphaera sp.]|uniref:ABC transporter permease n=1 Tax=Salinisphaera sp. TaxID=1914330 RepID=UPI0032C22D0D